MRLLFSSIALLAMFSPVFAVLEIPNTQPKVHANEWKWVLDSTWQGLKRRNIDAYSTGLVHRPKSETPNDAVSEGIGYGMLLALYANDQTYFDKIFNAGKQYNLSYCKNWHWPYRNQSDGGSATDADEDIALALIFAAKLVEKGKWQASSINYENDAQSAVNCVWGSMRGGQLCPGNGWCPGFNLGYFAPAWYRIFGSFSNNPSHDWQQAVNASYALIESSSSYDIGMVPDWNGGGGYNNYLDGDAFFKDAIRVLWRIANDAIWFGEERAKTFLSNALSFINSKGGPSAANFYQIQGQNKGELVPANDIWAQFNDETNQNTWRYRQEHSHLTVGQWLTAAMAVGTNEEKIAWSNEMAKFYDFGNRVSFFGNAVDPTGGIEDTLHNEMYFDQFLAWFGVSLMSGTWVNVVELLDNPVENSEGIPGAPASVKSLKPAKLGIQISQSRGLIQMRSQSNVTWKIHNLQGKLLFSSSSRETSWNAGGFKGAIAVSATTELSNSERKLLVIR
ncbi:MAG: hypothetical protein LBH25_04435 [Fibromonadaceae bacterium]|jgi:endo-1,4-beta-D-glucanase Y|nr:hypothetical protein [Fibromonadaceae bacterium]